MWNKREHCKFDGRFAHGMNVLMAFIQISPASQGWPEQTLLQQGYVCAASQIPRRYVNDCAAARSA